MAKHISVITCLFMMMVTSCVAVDHSVGDSVGWTLGLNYTSWISDKNFHVGDDLVFIYSREHTVVEVSSGEYTSCAFEFENSISKLAKTKSKRKSKKRRHRRWRHKSDTTIIKLETPGTHYFICAEPGHCIAGMKFSINVSAKGESPTPTPTCNNCPPPLAPPNGSSNIQPSTNNSLPGAQPSNVTAPLTQVPPYKKSGSSRAGLSNLPPFVAVLLALVSGSLCSNTPLTRKPIYGSSRESNSSLP